MAVATCPNPETLSAFARGDLGTDELSTVAEHVGGCETCCRALQLIPEDSLAGLARAAVAEPSTIASGVTPAPAGNGKPRAIKIPAGFVDHPRYRIVGELGAGGMGTVYKAEDTWMSRVVALKVVSPHLTAKASALSRFRKEVRAAAQLEHHNIVRAYDTGEAGGAQFLVMEFVEGVSLDRLVAKKGPLPIPMACTFARQAALGLQHADAKGMVHRDIKPQNLLVTRKGQVKILDFGLARFARSDDENEETVPPTQKLSVSAGNKPPSNAGVTNPGLLLGTPDYLSPEQAKNSHDVDRRSDVYSLGCTLYFLLTGKPPFGGASTLIDKLLAHTEEEPPAIRLERMDVTDELAAVLAKMMAKKPSDRYQTAAEAAAALLPLTRSDAGKEPGFEVVEAIPVVVGPLPHVVAMPVVTPLPSSPLVFDTAPEPEGPTVAELVKSKKKKSKKRAPWWKEHKWPILGAVALFALIAGAIAFTKKRPTDTPNDPPAIAKPTTPAPAKGDRSDKGSVSTPLAIAPPKASGVKVLYVLPSDGVWLPDYAPVRDRLKELGATVVTASTEGGSSRPHAETPGEPVPIDVRFTATMSLSEYDAVIFTGYAADEYMHANKGSIAAGKVIQRMQNEGKTVSAICVGQGVLVSHGALRNKKAADNEWVKRRFPWITNERSGIDWQSQGVVTDGKIVTASGAEQARPFADALIEAIKSK